MRRARLHGGLNPFNAMIMDLHGDRAVSQLHQQLGGGHNISFRMHVVLP